MIERPILFSDVMVRALLSRAKTQTRRIVKPQFGQKWGSGVPFQNGFASSRPGQKWKDAFGVDVDIASPSGHWTYLFCPYGKVGDRLWVRECFSLVPCSAGCERYPEGFDPKQSSASQPNAPAYGARFKATWDRCHSCGWKPSIHMPRWASRITLAITDIRVQRVQEIGEGDAIAEGWPKQIDPGADTGGNGGPFDWYRGLWNKINGPDSWQANPWVWAITFNVVKAGEA